MDDAMPFGVGISPDYSPLYTTAESTEVLSESFKYYDECEKNKSLENTSFDGSINLEPPDEQLMDKIIQQVEFLFSDTNILKDKFLWKHIWRNKEGYVNLKLISSLRKVKALTKDWRVVAYSLQKSQKLQLNNEVTKVKRRDPVPRPKILDPSRTVLVFHYLPNLWSEDNLKRQLNMFGSVVFWKIVDSKTDLWHVSIQKTLSIYRKIVTLPFAIIMFETPDEASNAVLHTSHPASIILKIVPVLKDEIFKRAMPKSKNEYPSRSPSQGSSAVRKTRFGHTYSKNEFLSEAQNEFFSSVKAQKCIYHNYKNPYQSQGDMLSPRLMKEKILSICSYKEDEPDNNAGYQKKSCFKKHKETQVFILRQPNGPDGTIGFWKTRSQQNATGTNICAL